MAAPIASRRAPVLDLLLLLAIVAATRIPFFAKTFFEYDSLNYAVALRNFDPGQDTPQMPGYLLHVGIARVLEALVHDANRAFVLESFLLSLGSVAFVWWGIGARAGRGASFWGGLVWALHPIFWLYGCVATVYPHEAFFTSAVAALCLRYVADAERQRTRMAYPFAIAATIAIAGAARQSSLVFLAPAAVVALWAVRPPLRIWLGAKLVALGIVLVWAGILLQLSGGLARYLLLARADSVVGSYSVLLGGTPARHASMLSKLLLFAVIGTAPAWTLVMWAAVRRRDALRDVLGRGLRSASGAVWIALVMVPMAFFALIFWAKPGYLLGVYAVVIIGAAILADRLAQRGVVSLRVWGSVWALIGVVFFTAPLPGKSVVEMHRQTAQTTALEVTSRYPSLPAKLEAALVRVYACGSAAGIAAVDQENLAVMRALGGLGVPAAQTVLLGDRWSQWAFFQYPKMTVYDFVETRGVSRPPTVNRDWLKHDITQTVEELPWDTEAVVLQMWGKHWALPEIRRQVHLEALPSPEHCELYRITDQQFRLRLGGITFVRMPPQPSHHQHHAGAAR